MKDLEDDIGYDARVHVPDQDSVWIKLRPDIGPQEFESRNQIQVTCENFLRRLNKRLVKAHVLTYNNIFSFWNCATGSFKLYDAHKNPTPESESPGVVEIKGILVLTRMQDLKNYS